MSEQKFQKGDKVSFGNQGKKSRVGYVLALAGKTHNGENLYEVSDMYNVGMTYFQPEGWLTKETDYEVESGHYPKE